MTHHDIAYSVAFAVAVCGCTDPSSPEAGVRGLPGAGVATDQPAAAPGQDASARGVSSEPSLRETGPALTPLVTDLMAPAANAGPIRSVADAGELDAGRGHPDATASPVTPAVPDRCDVGLYDPNDPPEALELSGDVDGHDPMIIAANGRYYYYSTGNGIATKTSPDLTSWTQGGPVFTTPPAWFKERIPAWPPTGQGIVSPTDVWAPDVSYFGGQYHLYYAVSSFGATRSCIGHATRADLDSGSWSDHDAVFCSNPPGQRHDFNAIDPNVVVDEAGTPWLAFGSYGSGIKLIQLDRDGNLADEQIHSVASRGGSSIEAPFVVRRCGYYYLFVSFDRCCAGAASTYKIRVGRSRDLLGPYSAKDGVAMLNGGGTLLLSAGNGLVGPGHNAIVIEGTRAYNVYHAYDAVTGAAQLHIAELVWDAEGWPISGGPLRSAADLDLPSRSALAGPPPPAVVSEPARRPRR